MPRLNVNDNTNSPKSAHYWMCRMKPMWNWPSRIFDRVHARDTKSTTTNILKSQLMSEFAIRNRHKAGSWEFLPGRMPRLNACIQPGYWGCAGFQPLHSISVTLSICDSFYPWLILCVTCSIFTHHLCLIYTYMLSLMSHIHIYIITNASYTHTYYQIFLIYTYVLSLMPHVYIHITHASYTHLTRAHVEAERGRQRMLRGRVGSRCVALSPAALPVQRRCDSLYMWLILCASFSRSLYMW